MNPTYLLGGGMLGSYYLLRIGTMVGVGRGIEGWNHLSLPQSDSHLSQSSVTGDKGGGILRL